jgi:CheY-like chemotaxis protein
LFKFFSQTESGRISKAGTGLGLAISQEYVRLMGGKIDVISRAGVGSKFYFDIKMQKASENSIYDKEQTKMVVGLKDLNIRPKILVVEDIRENMELLVKLLENSGFQVSSAENGKEAIEVFKTYEPDFIWMDIRMPVMDGLEATRQIKLTEPGKNTKVVAMSAHVFDEERETILASGFDGFLGKPFTESDIFSIMAKHLNLEYTYADYGVSEEEATYTDDKLIEDIGKIEINKIRKIYDAIIQLDDNKIHNAIKDIENEAPELSKFLNEEILKMSYTKIMRLFEGGIKQDGK